MLERRRFIAGSALSLPLGGLALSAVAPPALAQGAIETPDWFDVRNHGGMNITGLRNAIAAAANAGGGVVFVPRGTINLDSEVLISSHVDLIGSSLGATIFNCTTPGARIAFGTVFDTMHRGGLSGHFTINGQSLATNPLYLARFTDRLFQRIRVEGAADVGLLIEETQNSTFIACESVNSPTCLRIDVTAKNHSFFDCIFSGGSFANVHIRHSHDGATASGGIASKIHFFGGLQERLADSGEASTFIEAGDQIYINSVTYSGGPVSVKLEKTGPKNINGVVLSNLELQANTGGIGLKVVGGNQNMPVEVFLDDGAYFQKGAVAIETDDNAIIHAVSYRQNPNVPTFWRNSGGTKTVGQIVRQLGARQAALTAAATNVVNNVYEVNEATVINNLRTRVNELEARLRLAGIL